MVYFDTRYDTDLYNKNYPLRVTHGTILRPLYVIWNFRGRNFEILRNNEDFIISMNVSQEFILVCYSEDSLNFPAPNNLVLYNLKKEIIKVIPPPVPINWQHPSSIYSIGEEKIIDGRKYIDVWIGFGDPQYYAQVELRYLDLETFEYHPTEYKYNEIFQGR